MVGSRIAFGGEGFHAALAAALDELTDQREAINRLNVFPVPDGDTGTNMVLTLQAALREMTALQGRRRLDRVAQAAARGSLLGARGNSGVILSQLLRGVAADAGDGESRSGSASRSDSLIESGKTNVAILPLLILTATTNSDELS